MKILDLFYKREFFNNVIDFPYIIAEAGVNHEGSMDLAKRLIDEAKEGGADAIKFQSYKAETLASKNSPAYWDLSKEPTKSQYELFKKYDKFWKSEFEQLKKYCDEISIEFMSTPFDTESAIFLDDLMDVFKVSSSDITNKPFLQFICRFGKPIILSTGASYLYEIQETVSWIETSGNALALLHCILNYPTFDKDAHLGMITDLKCRFPEYMIGYSDHTLPKDMKTMEVAWLLGAVILEKHFTYDKTLPGNDHYHAMDKKDLKAFRSNCNRVRELMGTFKITSLEVEDPARLHARRSLVASRPIPAGKIVEYEDLAWKRPAHGISPRFINDVIGKKAVKEIDPDTILQWHFIE